MKKTFLAVALAVGTIATAQAQTGPKFRPLIGAGFTFGGDTLATVSYTDGSSEDIKGGGLVHLYAGGEFKLGDKVSVQGTVGYHVDNSSGRDGSVRFSRMPVDLIALYHLNDQVRLGVGAQFINNPELKGSGVASSVNLKFKSTTGVILEGEYMFSPNAGAKLRYVDAKFKPEVGSGDADGSHLGLMFSWYFN